MLGLDAGADDYLCKPFAFEELLAQGPVTHSKAQARGGIGRLVPRRPGGFFGAAAPSGPARPSDLTAKELALLAFFLRHTGEVLSRSRLYGYVWGEEYDFVSNTLDVHIKELRHKLELRAPADPHVARQGVCTWRSAAQVQGNRHEHRHAILRFFPRGAGDRAGRIFRLRLLPC